MHFITLAGHKTCLNCWLIQTPTSSVESPTVSPASGKENTNKQTKEGREGLNTDFVNTKEPSGIGEGKT